MEHASRPDSAEPSSANTDSFTSRFLARVPPDIARSFTPDQLRAVRGAFGMRYVMDHTVDVRRTVGLPWGRFYIVLLAGSDTRRCSGGDAPERTWRAMLRAVAGLAAASIAVLAWFDGGIPMAALWRAADILAP